VSTLTCCTFPKCYRPWKAHGYCSGHNQQVAAGLVLRPLRVSVERTEHTAVVPPSRDAYTHHGCRCPDCTREHSRAHKAWRLRVARTGPALTDSTGTLRRLRALCRVGWSRSHLGAMLGINKSNIEALIVGRAIVTKRTAAKVKRAYEANWQGPPAPTTPHEKAGQTRARRAAERHGWPPPAAWDLDIDEPDAEPSMPAGSSVGLAAAEVAHLLGSESAEAIAARLGYLSVDNLANTVGYRDKPLADKLRATQMKAVA